MEKRKNSQLKATPILSVVGILLVITTPLVQPILLHFLAQDCPLRGEVRECGLELGIKNAFYAETLPFIWLIIGLIILAIGITHYFLAKRSSRS